MNFLRARSVRDVVISVVLTLVGVALIFVNSIPVNILGCCLGIPGILMLLFLKTDYKDPENGKHYRRVIKYFPASRKAEVMSALKGDPDSFEWVEESAANGLMVDIYVGRDSDKVYVKVSEFIPYNYVPCSDWFEFDKKQAAKLVA